MSDASAQGAGAARRPAKDLPQAAHVHRGRPGRPPVRDTNGAFDHPGQKPTKRSATRRPPRLVGYPAAIAARDDTLAVAVLAVGADPQAAAGIRSLLDQRPAPEIVLVNTGGGDVSALLEGAGAGSGVSVVTREPRLNPGAARNLGIGATTARWVAFLAADCEALPGWVAGRLRAHREGAAAVAGVLVNGGPPSRASSAATLLRHRRMLRDTPSPERRLYGLSYARELFDAHGGFREDVRTGEDTDFNARLSRAGIAVARIEDVRTVHRNPDSPRALLRDLYMRGVRQERARRTFGQERPGRALASGALQNAAGAWRQAGQAADPIERRRLRRGWPLLVPGAAAYAAGALASARLANRESKPARAERRPEAADGRSPGGRG